MTYVWGEKGTRPRAVRDQRYECAYIFGAVCPARGVGAALVMPFANTHAMNAHLIEISSQVEEGAHAIVIIDGGGLAHDKIAQNPKQYQPSAVACLQPRVEPAGNHLAVSQAKRPRQPGL